MAADILNFVIDAGASWNEAITWSGQDITDRTLRMQLKRKRGGAVELELTEANGRIVVINGNSGHFTFNLNATETAALSGEYVYDLKLMSDSVSTDVVKLVRGVLFVRGEVTT